MVSLDLIRRHFSAAIPSAIKIYRGGKDLFFTYIHFLPPI